MYKMVLKDLNRSWKVAGGNQPRGHATALGTVIFEFLHGTPLNISVKFPYKLWNSSKKTDQETFLLTFEGVVIVVVV